MLLYIALCLAAALAEDIGDQLPRWSKVYSMKIDSYLPALDLPISYKYWYDGIHNKYRLDNEKTTVKYTSEANLTDLNNSPNTIVQLCTDEEHMNLRICYIIKWKFDYYNYLPNLEEGYAYRGQERMHGKDSARWEMIIDMDETREENNIWVTLKQGVFIPLKMEYKKHATKLGTLLDHYYMDIFDFDTSEINPKIWDIGFGLNCTVYGEDVSPIGGDVVDQALDFPRPFQNHEVLNDVHDEFDSFKLNFNKAYQSDEEHNRRLQIFKDNVKFINEHNNAGHSYKLRINHFADLTKEELAMMKRRRPRSGPSKALPFPYTAGEIERLSEDIPKHFDWRPYGAVTPVKNQDIICLSSWAFSAVGAVEGALFLRDGREQVLRLSEQALIDCSSGFGNYGCDGGYPEQAYEWIKKHGLPNDDAYGGYIAHDGVCHIDNVTKEVYVKAYYEIPEGNERALKVALLKHGPISVEINVPHEMFFYSHGVFYSSKCTDVPIHDVLLVGYGTLDGEEYWLIKNSFSTGWGDSGYILMSTKDNNCLVESYAKYVELQ